MNAEDEIRNRAHEIREMLLDSRLKDALELMQAQMNGVQDWSVTSRYEDMERSYRYMLQYFAKGSPDEHRNEVYRQLIHRAILLNDDILQARLQQSSMLLYYQHLRSRMSRNDTLENLQKALESFAELGDANTHERTLANLFDMVWTSGLWTSESVSQMSGLAESPLVLPDDAAFAVSAVTMALLERFDPAKMLFLCREAQSVVMQVSIRALTGLAVTLVRYTDILPHFPEIRTAISVLSDDATVRERMLKVQMALLLCRETKEIDRRMREEIIPTMLSNPKLGDIMTSDMERDDANPDWLEWAEKNDVKDKLMQMTELQIEGADVYMSTFSNLKSYPFFREPCNWFRVFSMDQPDVKSSISGGLAKAMLSGNVFCNSDKYSFALTFSQIPQQQRDMIMGQMGEQLEQELSDLKESPASPQQQETFCARQYVQDLYRFFNLFSRRHEFWNPFESNLNMLSNSCLSTLLESAESSRTIAAWLLGKKYFTETAAVFRQMAASGHPDSADYRFYQQMGYALQRVHEYADAMESYSRSDILQSGNSWTMRHMAQCQRMLGRPEKALDLLLEIERTDSDDLSLQIQIGDCLVDLKRYDEALTRFFKVDYLKPDYPKAWRAIAWCAFLAGRYDRSDEYYGKLTEGSPTGQDCLNAAHVRWVQGDVAGALKLYARSIGLLGREAFLEEFDNDRHILTGKGIPESDIPLLLDSI